jgi:hypothetical protein
MTTPLRKGKTLAREVTSQVHDARREKALIVELDHTHSRPVIRLRPKGRRDSVEITLDGLYELLTKRMVT